MLKKKLLVSAIAMVALSACGQASGRPGDMIIGKWRGTASPTDCPQTELIITRDTFTSMQAGVAYKYTVLGIDAQTNSLGNWVNVSRAPGGVDPYKIIDNNHVELQTVFRLCPYTRE